MEMTGLSFRKDGKSFRCECPVHGGGKRSLVVSPGEPDDKGDDGVFYCHAEGKGGDRVMLLAHVRDSKPYAVFKELHEQRPPEMKKEPQQAPQKAPKEKEEGSSPERGFRELPYLDHEADAVQAMGLEPEVAKALGIGFAPRGFHKQRIAVPVRLADGRLVGYISILGENVKLPPDWKL